MGAACAAVEDSLVHVLWRGISARGNARLVSRKAIVQWRAGAVEFDGQHNAMPTAAPCSSLAHREKKSWSLG